MTEIIPVDIFNFHRFMERRPLINDDLPGRILQGALVMKPNLKELKSTSAVFEDGSQEENIHAVIFCTGYKGTFPFLDTALSGGTHGELTLYKYAHDFSKRNKLEIVDELKSWRENSITPVCACVIHDL